MNTLGSKFSFKRYAKTSAWWVIEIDAARAVPKKKRKKKEEREKDAIVLAKQKWREFEGIISRNWDPSQRKQRYVSPLPRKLIRPNFTRLHYIRPLPLSLSFSKMQEGRKAQKISLRSSIRSERVYCFARVDDFSSTRYPTRWLVPLGYRRYLLFCRPWATRVRESARDDGKPRESDRWQVWRLKKLGLDRSGIPKEENSRLLRTPGERIERDVTAGIDPREIALWFLARSLSASALPHA